MQFLYNIHYIISNILHDKCKYYCIYFQCYSKKIILILILKQQFISYVNEKYLRNNIKIRTYYLFNGVINIKKNLLKIGKKSCKNIDIN